MDHRLAPHPGRAWRRLVCLLCSLALLGCTSLRPVAPSGAPDQAPGAKPTLRPGDEVQLRRKDGSEILLTVSAWTPEALTGSDGTRTISVPRAEIDTLTRREFDALKTAALVAACLFVVHLSVQAVGAAKILNSGTPR